MTQELDLVAQQVALEEEAYNTSLDKYEAQLARAIENGSIAESKEVIIVVKVMIDSLSKHIQDYYDLNLRGHNKEAQTFFKELLPNPRDMSYFLMKSVMKPLFKGKQKVALVAKTITNGLSQNNKVKNLSDTAPKLHSYITKTNKKRGDGVTKRQLVLTARKLAHKDLNATISLGTCCIDLIMGSGCGMLTLTKEGDTNYLEFSKATKELILRSKVFFGSMITAHYPLIVEPKPWDSLQGGGGYYSYDNIDFIKTKTTRDLNYILEKRPNLSRLFDVVNTISRTPYRINTRVLDTVNTIIKHRLVNATSSVFNPVLYGDIPYMDVMVANDLITKADYGEIGDDGKFVHKEDKVRWLKAVKEQEDRIITIESKRLQYKLALQVAERYKKYERFYFSYQVDFRGRLYPIQQFLNPQTSDNIKPLLEFADGQILTESGVYWLKVHGANCFGYDKLPYNERVAKIDEMIPVIKKIAQDPIGNLKLWYGADAPLQFLAFCFGFADYLHDPKHPVHVPVALDATCSGLQVYSGLLRDHKGAMCVNVVNNPEHKVADIYADVAVLVNKYLLCGDYPKVLTYTTKDGVEHTESTIREAQSIAGKIDRKITKRNVMTQPYSVTERGMYEQLYSLLTEYEDNNKKFWEGEKFIVCRLLALLNAKAIAETVKGASIGQQTLKEVLRESMQKTNEAFWYTPIFRFPVLQRIFREKAEQIRTPLGRLVLYHATNQVHYLRMLNGIAPNFIHSLDATLLYRTVEIANSAGVASFWLIHDSFSVGANDVQALHKAFREAYVEVFKLQPLQQWVNQILPSKSGIVQDVMINDLNLDEVLDSDYIIC